MRDRRRLFVAMLAAAALAACTGSESGDAPSGGSAMGQSNVTQLVKEDTKVGTGAEARPGTSVTVHYTGWLYDAAKPDHRGSKFDSSRDRAEPFVFGLGGGQVIRGWDEGVAGMKVGGSRTLTIPPRHGLRRQGRRRPHPA